jgi:AcrR family transcriptional regulator
MQSDVTEGGDELGQLGVAEPAATDGRLARGQRTRRKVAEALVELLRDGDPDPTAKTIAERAGVSLRLVFHHFNDIDDLYRAVGALQYERHWTSLPCPSTQLPVSARIDKMLKHRGVLYEEIAPVRRAALRRASASPGITEVMAYTDGLLKANLADTFAPELAARDEEDRAELLTALDAASAWEVWDHMRRSELTIGACRDVMARTVAALLTVNP